MKTHVMMMMIMMMMNVSVRCSGFCSKLHTGWLFADPETYDNASFAYRMIVGSA